MINKYFLLILIVLISGCQASNQTKGDGSASFNTSSSSSTSFTVSDNLPRLALVIGNSNYQKASWLANPLNDADDMAAVLRNLGFEVILEKDINRRSMKRAVNNFTRQLNREKGIGLFYFSGHGLQDDTLQNYLIPVDADIKTSADIQYEAVSSQRILDKMTETNNKLNLLILDACRDSLPEQNKGYIKKGLAAMKGSLGSLVAYATAPNTSALGSTGTRNSVYTKYLVEALKTKSHLSVSDMLTNVSKEVYVATKNQQIPWQTSSMTDIFCFSRCGIEPGVFQDLLKDGGLGPKMVMIAGGSFRMGDIQGGGHDSEQSVHRVSVRKFAMGVYEVTVGEYMKFFKATNTHAPEWLEKGSSSNINTGSGNYYKKFGSALTNKNHPIIGVSWHDAVAYTKWLSNQTGKYYRLPTEVEWEYAARAGTETKYWWGNDIDKSKANYGRNLNKTSPAGNYKANKFGLYDTVGNVWEWTCSEYEDKYKGKEKQCVTNANSLSLRGGSWGNNPRRMRSASRFRFPPTDRYDFIGFRVSRH